MHRIEFRGDHLSVNGTIVSDVSPSLANGNYLPVVFLEDGRTLVLMAPVLAKIAITSVSPPAGSIGGSTIMTINGEGKQCSLSCSCALCHATGLSPAGRNGCFKPQACQTSRQAVLCVPYCPWNAFGCGGTQAVFLAVT